MTDTVTQAEERELVPWGLDVSEAKKAEDAIMAAGLDWDVELHPLYYKNGGYQEVPGRFASVRSTDHKLLGTVGSHYHTFPNRQAFGFIDSLVDSGDAKFIRAGEIGGGRRVFLLAELPDGVEVAGGDPCKLYLLLRTSHDGTAAVTVNVTPVRIGCTNMMNLAVREAKNRWAVPHVSTIEGRISEARETLGLTFTYVDKFKELVEQLVSVDVGARRASNILDKVLPDRPKTPEVKTEILGLLESSPTIEDDHRKTGWGLVNALGEYYDWTRGTRRAEARFLASVDGIGQKVRNRAARLLLEAA